MSREQLIPRAKAPLSKKSKKRQSKEKYWELGYNIDIVLIV